MRRALGRLFIRAGSRLLRYGKPPEQPTVVPESREQVKALKAIGTELRHQRRMAEKVLSESRVASDAAKIRQSEGESTGSGLPVRIESDGVGIDTRVLVGDVPVSNATRVTWSVDAGGLARAYIEFDKVAADVTGETVEHG